MTVVNQEHNLKICIVDDDPVFTHAAKMLFSFEFPHYNPQIFNSPVKALESLESQIPDILFVDINMPEIDGWQLLEKLPLQNQNCKIYILSSSVDSRDINKAKKYSVVQEFLSKPLTIKLLRQILN